MLKTSYIDVMDVLSEKLYVSAAQIIDTACKIIPANTFCIALSDEYETKVLNTINRSAVILQEGLVIDHTDSYCHLVTENGPHPLVIDDNRTHPLTRDMDVTPFIGGCSFMGVTIKDRDGHVFGSLCAFDDNFYAYQPHDVELLQSLAAFFENMLDLDQTYLKWRESEQERARALEEKANLLAILSHEIRTPMNAILNMGEMLQATPLSDQQTQYLNLIHGSGRSLMTILNQILDYSKLDSGKMEVVHEPFSLRGCLSEVVQLFRAEADPKNVGLNEIIAGGVPDLWIGDENKIRQVLVNLLSNALKFTEKGEIRIEASVSPSGGPWLDQAHGETFETLSVSPVESAGLVEQGGSYLTFTVTDTGSGIAADKQPLLFQAFTQLHTANYVNRYGGTGLGLSICKQLVNLMNGQLRLRHSSAAGTCFAFSLPLRLPEKAWGY
ncbi:GAF domain-containing hybrid sensor histidine kinase/response regulator [Saccharibacillus qingshengii]|uniref:GAF domain-containing hybrid sensor histidine kinase/response regulator n=1 Tax=Saccharibacillus qingshengii TaxID=1763540 RepID=UPI001551B848|nr:ATP-binding protein [Saccharibacillus qingshengii]